LGKKGLRSFSALAGTATVPVAYLAATTLVSRRAGLITAALVAFSPLMVWYSQEARPYALAVFLAALSFLFFARALKNPGPRNLIAWGLTSALALATQYLTLLFMLAPELLVLWWALRGRRTQIALALSPVIGAGIALLPLLAQQADYVRSIELVPGQGSIGDVGHATLPLAPRLERLAESFTVGFSGPDPYLLAGVIGLMLIGMVLVVLRGKAGERRGALVAAAVGLGAALIAGVTAPFGSDFILSRYLLPLWLPLIMLVAIGFGAARARLPGLLGAAALCAVWLGVILTTNANRDLQRPDWQGLAEALGPTDRPRLISVADGIHAAPLLLYLDHARFLTEGEAARFRELVYVYRKHLDPSRCGLWISTTCAYGDRERVRPPGFRSERNRGTETFGLERLTSSNRTRLSATGSGVFLQVAG
jgi:mannosyltransferase